jgi:hypothetical protein
MVFPNSRLILSKISAPISTLRNPSDLVFLHGTFALLHIIIVAASDRIRWCCSACQGPNRAHVSTTRSPRSRLTVLLNRTSKKILLGAPSHPSGPTEAPRLEAELFCKRAA